MAQTNESFRLQVERVDGYEFRVRFDKPGLPALVVDEPPPLGHEIGPNPARLLAASVGSCLSASLLFCLSRANVPVQGLTSDVSVDLERNARRRLRIGRISVRLRPHVADPDGLAKCVELFEDFCVVTQSVREGIDVQVAVDLTNARNAAQGERAAGDNQ